METALTNQFAIDTPFPLITEQPIMWGDHRRPEAADQYKALVDLRTGRVFSIVTQAYELITHEEAIDRVETILADCEELKVYQTGIEFYNEGARMMRSYTFPRVSADIQVGDVVQLGLNLFNSYDTSWPFTVYLSAFRLVCRNGLVVNNKFLYIRKRHTFRLAEVDLEKNIKTAVKRFEGQTREWQRMAEVGLSNRDYKAVMETMSFGKEATEIIEDELRRQAREVTPWGLPIMTLWVFYNVMTAYITRYAVSLNHRVELENRLRLAMQRVRVPRRMTTATYPPIRPSRGLFVRNR